MAFKCAPLALISLILILIQLNSSNCARLNAALKPVKNSASDVEDVPPIEVLDLQEAECLEANADDERCLYRAAEDVEMSPSTSLEELRFAKLVAAYFNLLEREGGLASKLKKVRDLGGLGPKKNIQKKLEKQKTLKDFFALRF